MACSCMLPPPLRAAPCDGSEARRVCVPQLAEKLTGLERGTRRSVTRAATLSVRTSRQASFARRPAQPCARFYCALPTFAGSSTTCWGACCVLRRRLASGLSHGSAEGLHGDQQPRRRRHCTATPSRVGTVPPSPLYSCFLRLTDTLRSLPAPSQNDDRIVAISNGRVSSVYASAGCERRKSRQVEGRACIGRNGANQVRRRSGVSG